MKISQLNQQIVELDRSAQYITNKHGMQTGVVLDADLWHQFLSLLNGNSIPNQPDTTVDDETDERVAMHREELAFRRMHPSLVEKYMGKYVAIYQEELVDHDSDQIELYLRVKKKYPKATFMIAPVNEQAEELINVRSLRYL